VYLPLFILTLIGLAAWGIVDGTARLNVVLIEVPLSRLPAELDGLNFTVLTDIHLGTSVGATAFSEIVSVANSYNPSMHVIIGDFLDAADGFVDPMVMPTKQLNAPVAFVTGNHEYLAGSVPVKLAYLRSLGVTILENDVLRVSIGAGGKAVLATNASLSSAPSFDLLGVPDWAESIKPGPWIAANLPGAVMGRNASRELVVIAHQPRHAPQAIEAGAGLILHGHVHCGQLLPAHFASYLVNPYFGGLYIVDSRHPFPSNVYVSCGAVGWGPLYRQAAPKDITLVVLRSQSVVGPHVRATMKRIVCTGTTTGC
jgi:predicted MPP superfamily phosphohydrolase